MSYQDTQQKIQKTLTGRNSGTQITPDSHQNMAETMLNYIQEVENISVSSIEGIAYPDTEPLQPDAANVVYISAVPSNTTYTYKSFADENGDAVSITATTDPLFVILFWNKKYWSYLATTSAPHLHISAELTDSNEEVPSSKAVSNALQDIYKRSNPNDENGNVVDTNTIFGITDNPQYVGIFTDLDGRFLGGFEKEDGNFVFVNKVPRDIQDAINAAVKQLQTADQTLKENIDAEGKARQTADQTLKENIDAEGKARQTADQTLKENIDAEIQDVYKKSNYNDGDNIIDFNTIHIIKDSAVWFLLLVDANDKFVFGISRKDGQPYWGVGVPKVIKDYVDKQINDILGTNNITETIDSLKEVEDFLADFKNSDTLKALLDTKANKVDVDAAIANINVDIVDKYKKSNPNDNEGNITDTRDILKLTSNNKFALMLIDSLGKVLDAVGKDGIRRIFTDLNIKGATHLVTTNPKFIFMLTDSDDKFIFGFDRKTGTPYYGYGVPKQVKDFVDEATAGFTKETLESVEKFKVVFSKGNIIFTDKDDKVLLAIGLKNKNKSFLPFDIQGADISVIDNPFCILIITDKDGRPFLWVRKDLSIDYAKGCPKPVREFVNDFVGARIKELNIPDYHGVVERNMNRQPALYAACHMSSSKKDFQLEIVTDTHNNYKSLQNAVKIANGFDSIDAIIHDGDIVSGAGGLEHDYAVARMQDLAKSNKPWLITIGNHEVGQPYNIKASLTHESIYNLFIKPMIDAGQLKDGEWSDGQIYYYHDFTSEKLNKKIRLISLYEFDNPLDVDDTNPYWEKIDYNSSYPQIEQKQYVYDENNPIYVNCGDFTNYSFKLKQSVEVNFYDSGNGKSPKYKIDRFIPLIGKEQANWLAKTLLSTPEDYGIIIAAHYPINGENQKQLNFASNRYEHVGGLPYIAVDLARAYNDRTILDKNVVCVGKAEYLNTLKDSNNNKYWYNVKADFTAAKAKILGFIGGHVHYDLVVKDTNNFYGIYPTSGVIDIWSIEDTARTMNDDLAFDAITVTSWAENRIALTRIGNLYSTDGKKMDLEIIDTTK